jgi:hypothetical protein
MFTCVVNLLLNIFSFTHEKDINNANNPLLNMQLVKILLV